MGTLLTPLPLAAVASTAVAPAIGATQPYNATGSRTDTVNTTVGSPVVTDTAVTSADQGLAVVGLRAIPAGCYVGTVIAGTSFRLSSSPTSQVDVNALVTASTTATIATGTLKPTLPALSGLRNGARLSVQKASSDTSSNPVIATCAGSDTLDSGATSLTLRVPGEIRELQVHTVAGTKVWKVVNGNTPVGAQDLRYATLAQSQVSAALFPPTMLRGDAIDSFVARPNGSDPTRHVVEWINDDSGGNLFHLVSGPTPSPTDTPALIAMGVDNNRTGLYVHNRPDYGGGVGIKITQEATITNPNHHGLRVNQASGAVAAWFGIGSTTGTAEVAQFCANVIPPAGQKLVTFRTTRTALADTLLGYVDAASGAFVWQGGASFQPETTAGIPMLVVGLSGQTANLQEWRVAGGGGTVGSLDKSGNLTVAASVTGTTMQATSAGANMSIYDTSGTAGSRRFRIGHSTGYMILSARNDDGTSARDLMYLKHADRSLGLMGSLSFGGGSGVIAIGNATTVPTTNPTGGAILYADTGAIKGRGASGTVTTIAPAEPHCPDCDRDFALEWDSAKYGHLSLCMWCLTEGFTKGVMNRREA